MPNPIPLHTRTWQQRLDADLHPIEGLTQLLSTLLLCPTDTLPIDPWALGALCEQKQIDLNTQVES